MKSTVEWGITVLILLILVMSCLYSCEDDRRNVYTVTPNYPIFK